MLSNLPKITRLVRGLQPWVLLRFVGPGDWSHGKCRERKMIITSKEGKKLKEGNTNIITMTNMFYLNFFLTF